MIEHINIIDILYEQIAALLVLMQCADRDCTDIRSVNTASEMCSTMLDELKGETYKKFEKFKGASNTISNVQTNICDDYCRYTNEGKLKDIEGICDKCPLCELDKIWD